METVTEMDSRFRGNDKFGRKFKLIYDCLAFAAS